MHTGEQGACDGPEPSHEIATDELIGRGRNGESRAFDLLFERYRPMVRDYVRTQFPNIAYQLGVDDLVQDGLLRAFRSIETYRSEGRFRAWLVEVVHSEVLDRLRYARRRIPAASHEESERSVQESSTTPSQHAMAAETYDRLSRQLADLDEESRQIVILHSVCQVPHADIAEHLNITVAAVRKRFSRALARIGLADGYR